MPILSFILQPLLEQIPNRFEADVLLGSLSPDCTGLMVAPQRAARDVRGLRFSLASLIFALAMLETTRKVAYVSVPGAELGRPAYS